MENFSNESAEKVSRIELIMADITKLGVDAIVNAANRTLLGGGGVDGAIHRAAGIELYNECKTLNGCETGRAKITKAYRLPSRFVIHTVGPVWRNGTCNEAEMLKSCYLSSLELARQIGIKTIAFPNISTGIYGFPKVQAAKIAVETVQQFLQHNFLPEKVFFCCFDDENFQIYKVKLR